MSENLQESVNEIDRDLDRSWIDLSGRVRVLADGLKLKSAGTNLSAEAGHLAQEVSQLCDHVERLHGDVIDLLGNLESHGPAAEADLSADRPTGEASCSDVEKESIKIQREHHELRSNFKDVVKALFLWRDDPVERVREKE